MTSAISVTNNSTIVIVTSYMHCIYPITLRMNPYGCMSEDWVKSILTIATFCCLISVTRVPVMMSHVKVNQQAQGSVHCRIRK